MIKTQATCTASEGKGSRLNKSRAIQKMKGRAPVKDIDLQMMSCLY